MTDTGRWARVPGVLAPVAVLVVLLVLVAAATSGPVDVLGHPTRTVHPVAQPSASPSASAAPTAAADPLARYRHPRSHALAGVGDLISWAFFLAVVAAVLAGLVWLWRHRWRRPPPAAQLDVEPLPDVAALAESLRRDAAAQTAMLERGDPRDGIVRCWLRLEEMVADAGLVRQPAETSTEYAVRVLHVLDLDPRTVGGLAALFREARFSRHRLDEGARERARGLLDRLHDELGATGATGATAGAGP